MKIKRMVLVSIIINIFVIGLSGCGMPRAEQLADGLLAIEFDSVGADVFIESQMSANINEKNRVAKINNTYKLALEENTNSDKQEFLASMIVDNSSDLFGQYINNNNCNYFYKDGIVYADRDDAFYQAKDEEIRNIICKETLNKLKVDIINILYKSEVNKETKMYGEEECYVLEYNLHGNELYNYLCDIASLINVEDEFHQLFTMLNIDNEVEAYELLTYTPVIVEAAISTKSGYLVALDLDMSGIDVNGGLEFVGQNWETISNMMGIEISDFNMDDLYIGMNFYEYDNTSVAFPEELDNALECEKDEFYKITIPGFEEDLKDNYSADDADVDSDEDLINEDVDISEKDISNQNELVAYADDDKTVCLYNSDGDEVCSLAIPDEVRYYSLYSEPDNINLMSDDGSIDCYISCGVDKGYGNIYLKAFVEEGNYSDNFSGMEELLTCGEHEAIWIKENNSEKNFFVTNINDNQILISFNNGLPGDGKTADVEAFLNEVFSN